MRSRATAKNHSKIKGLLDDAGISNQLDPDRGYDHGVFVPLMLMYPKADVPVVSVSLHASLDPEIHIRMGKALASLRDEGVLIIGSGFTYHNLPSFFNPTSEAFELSARFHEWLKTTMVMEEGERSKNLIKWKDAPGALHCHPREEHLVPLFVVAGAGGSTGAEIISEDPDTFSATSFIFK